MSDSTSGPSRSVTDEHLGLLLTVNGVISPTTTLENLAPHQLGTVLAYLGTIIGPIANELGCPVDGSDHPILGECHTDRGEVTVAVGRSMWFLDGELMDTDSLAHWAATMSSSLEPLIRFILGAISARTYPMLSTEGEPPEMITTLAHRLKVISERLGIELEWYPPSNEVDDLVSDIVAMGIPEVRF